MDLWSIVSISDHVSVRIGILPSSRLVSNDFDLVDLRLIWFRTKLILPVP